MRFSSPLDFINPVKHSVFDLSKTVRTSLMQCLNIPIYHRMLYADESIDLSTATLLQSQPLLAPLMGTYTLRTEVYFEPLSNLYGWIDNNTKLTTQQIYERKRHTLKLSGMYINPSHAEWLEGVRETDGLATCVNKSSLLDFLGICSGYTLRYSGDDAELNDVINAEPVLTYLDIIRNYHCNTQETQIPFVQSFYSQANVDPNFAFGYMPVTILDSIFKELRNFDDGVNISTATTAGLSWLKSNFLHHMPYPKGGLFPTLQSPDSLMNFISDGNQFKSRVSTQGNQFTIDSLRFQNKLQRVIDRLDVSGGRFSDWLRTLWGVNTHRKLDIPELIAVRQQIIDANTITSTSDTASAGGLNLGDFAGNFNRFDKNGNVHFKTDVPGYIMVLVSLTPNLDYCEGVERHLLSTSFLDDYNPEMGNLGFTPKPFSDYCFLPSWMDNEQPDEYIHPSEFSLCREVAWQHLMSENNRLHGEFATNGDYKHWTLTRSFLSPYDREEGSQRYNLTRYLNPLQFQYPFVMQRLQDDNFFLQLRINQRAVRPIGKRYMPTLE